MKNILYLYWVGQTQNCRHDTYDSMIICAESEDQARELSFTSISGGISPLISHKNNNDWIQYSKKHLIQVFCIGTANKNIKKGAILKSFNAG